MCNYPESPSGQNKAKETREVVDSLEKFVLMFPNVTHPLTSEADNNQQ